MSSVTTGLRWRNYLGLTLALYVTFVGGSLTSELLFWPRAIYHAVWTVLLAVWLVNFIRRGRPLPTTPLDRPLLAVWIVCVLATLLALDPRVSAEALWQIGVYILLFYFVVSVMRRSGARAVLEPLMLTSGVVILVALMEFLSWYFGLGWLPGFRQGWPQIGGLEDPIPPVIYRLSFTLGVSTGLSAYLGLLIPIGLAWMISSQSSGTRKAFIFWLIGAAVAQVLTFSRGGFLSLAVSLPTFGVLSALGQPDWRAQARHLLGLWRVWLGALAALGAAVVVIILWLRFGGAVVHIGSDDVRLDLWQSALRIGLDDPLTGAGPYSFGRAMRGYRNPTITADHFTTANSTPLHVWAETGSLGLLAAGWLVAIVALTAVRRWRVSSGAERMRISGVSAALVGFSINNLVDTFNQPPIVLPVIALCAFLVLPVDPAPIPGEDRRRIIPVVMLAIVALFAVGWAYSDLAQYHFDRAIRLRVRGDLSEALDESTTALRLDPAMGIYAAQYAQYLGEFAVQEDTRTALDQALVAYEVALGHDDSYPLTRANYAMLLARSGDEASALAEMREALRLQPNDWRLQLWVGVLADTLDEQELALESYMLALERRPQAVASVFWNETPTRMRARDALLSRHGVTSLSLTHLGDLSPACWPVEEPLVWFDAADNAAQIEFCRAEIFFFVEDNPAGALTALDESLAVDDAQPQAYLLRAEAKLALGQVDGAERDARIALFLGEGRSYHVLGRVAEAEGDLTAAEQLYRLGGPVIIQPQGWDLSVYLRRGDLLLMWELDAPGPNRYDFASWVALIELCERQSRTVDAQAVRDAILLFDPYFPNMP